MFFYYKNDQFKNSWKGQNRPADSDEDTDDSADEKPKKKKKWNPADFEDGMAEEDSEMEDEFAQKESALINELKRNIEKRLRRDIDAERNRFENRLKAREEHLQKREGTFR